MMILPTIIGLTESALRAVPTQYYEGAVALGGTHERAIFTVVLPAAKSGVVAAIVLGIGRAIGETMAVIMVAGNQPRMPRGIFQGVRTLTANIVIEMGYASGLQRGTDRNRCGTFRIHPAFELLCGTFEQGEES